MAPNNSQFHFNLKGNNLLSIIVLTVIFFSQ